MGSYLISEVLGETIHSRCRQRGGGKTGGSCRDGKELRAGPSAAGSSRSQGQLGLSLLGRARERAPARPAPPLGIIMEIFDGFKEKE